MTEQHKTIRKWIWAITYWISYGAADSPYRLDNFYDHADEFLKSFDAKFGGGNG